MPTLTSRQAAGNFISLLDAACRRIESTWFLLPVAKAALNGSTRAYRERVYCYELYHQLRCLSDANEGRAAGAPVYVLSGEIDKAGLNAVTAGGREKPDLVWHVPGDSLHNAVVVEIKSTTTLRRRDLAKDITTIEAFLSAPCRAYDTGVLLVFGPEDSIRLQKKVREAFERTSTKLRLDRARLLWHPAAGVPLRDLGPIVRLLR